MEGEEASGNLKICGFSGRFPDGRNCFSYAYASEKPSATYTPPRPCVSKRILTRSMKICGFSWKGKGAAEI